MIHHGDLFNVLPTLAEASVDACVTDPPYGIAFMGREWDNFRRARNDADAGRDSVMGRLSRTAPASVAETDRNHYEQWSTDWAREVFRVLKPGAYLLAFGATRNYHRMTCGIEDAGFDIRDCFSWLYGSGFPKSMNCGDGRGTALKPANEPIVVARKPFKGSLLSNLAKHGTGALNIDACRIGHNGRPSPDGADGIQHRTAFAGGGHGPSGSFDTSIGRWPANVLLDEEAAELLDQMSGELTSGARTKETIHAFDPDAPLGGRTGRKGGICEASVGGASRFFYVAKPARSEREHGIFDLEPKQRDDSRKEGNPGGDNPRNRGLQLRGNHHPTVKPVELMRWLVRLVTPPGGVVLDPFCGSGTTGMACAYEFREFIGIEREAEYVEIARRRIANCAPLFTETA